MPKINGNLQKSNTSQKCVLGIHPHFKYLIVLYKESNECHLLRALTSQCASISIRTISIRPFKDATWRADNRSSI